MARSNNAPKDVTWIICLVLYVIAVLSAFNVIHLGGQIGLWSWVIGYALLLVAVKVKGL
jgi:hypothetical protein